MYAGKFSDDIEEVKRWLGSGSINIFGMPFAGKDTQGDELAKLFDAPLVSGGHILRNSIIPEHVKKTMERGELVPQDEYIRIVLPYLSQANFAGKPLILSSVGRWHGEEAGVLAAAAAAEHPLRTVIFLTIPEEVAMERHRRAAIKERGDRPDDRPEILAVRLSEFREKTLPVINFYRDKNLLTEVDGTDDPDATTQMLIAKLAERARA